MMPKATSREKGNVLEDVVAWVHEIGASSVQTRVKLKAIDAEHEREIDVLVTQDLAGYPVRLAIECKNEKSKIGIGHIDAFVGKLDDIGVSPLHGIFVTPIGYTPAAVSRAKKKGIVLLTLEGLDSSRLAAAFNAALMNVIHYVLFVDLDAFPFLPVRAKAEHEWLELPDASEKAVLDHLWSKWVTTRERVSLGETEGRFHGPGDPGGTVASLRVVGYVGQIPGTAKHVALTNAASKKVERARFAAQFQVPNSLDLLEVRTDQELARLTQPEEGVAHVLRHRVLVPRIIAANVYWPPTIEAMKKVIAMRERGERITFDAVEGQDLSRAWVASSRAGGA